MAMVSWKIISNPIIIRVYARFPLGNQAFQARFVPHCCTAFSIGIPIRIIAGECWLITIQLLRKTGWVTYCYVSGLPPCPIWFSRRNWCISSTVPSANSGFGMKNRPVLDLFALCTLTGPIIESRVLKSGRVPSRRSPPRGRCCCSFSLQVGLGIEPVSWLALEPIQLNGLILSHSDNSRRTSQRLWKL